MTIQRGTFPNQLFLYQFLVQNSKLNVARMENGSFPRHEGGGEGL